MCTHMKLKEREEINHLDSKRSLFLSFELADNSQHVKLQQSENMGLYKLRELLVVFLQPLETQDHEKGLFSDQLLASPERTPGPAVVELGDEHRGGFRGNEA